MNQPFFRHFKGRWNAIVGAGLLGAFLLLAVAGAIHTPHDPLDIDIARKLLAPGAAHWFGTDQYGRDVLSRVMTGAGASLMISCGSVFFALVAGVAAGTLAGYLGGWFDRIAMALMDALMAFPSLLLALAIMAVLGPSQFGVVGALACAYTPAVVRVARATVLSLREKEFVEASRAAGNTLSYTLLRHIVPNCIGPLTVLGTSLFAAALLSESALSFLGLGVPPPAPTWGGMLADARQFISSASWLALFPGLSISLVLLGINLFGDALRDYFDPRMNCL